MNNKQINAELQVISASFARLAALFNVADDSVGAQLTNIIAAAKTGVPVDISGLPDGEEEVSFDDIPDEPTDQMAVLFGEKASVVVVEPVVAAPVADTRSDDVVLF